MKKGLLSVVLCAGLILTVSGLYRDANAQIEAKRARVKSNSAESLEPASPDLRISSVQQIARGRQTGRLAPADPCTTTVTIMLSQPMVGTLTTSDCRLTNGSFIDFYDFRGTAGQAILVSEASTAFDTYLFLLDSTGTVIDQNDDTGTGTNSRIPVDGGVMTLPYTGHYTIGATSYRATTGTYTVTVDTDARCTLTPVAYNQAVNGALAITDCPININDQPYYTDLYSFSGFAGQQISMSMNSTAIDSYLILHTPSGTGSLVDDDSGGSNNARIPASGMLTLPESGIYTIEASSSGPGEAGNYTVTVVGPVQAPVTVNGKVLTSDGRGLRNATVSITDSQGTVRTTTTSSFGLFAFDNVLTGDTYTIRVLSRLFRYTPRTVQLNGNLTLPDFVGLE